MLSNLRKMIDAELENDNMIDMMLEASDSIADMFIEDDGEAEIDENEILNILNKIPEYDEEKELNKKLDRIAESCIPEDMSYVEERMISRRQAKKWSNDELQQAINELKEEINDYQKVINTIDDPGEKELGTMAIKDATKDLQRVQKELEKRLKKAGTNKVEESTEELPDDGEYLNESVKDIMMRIKRSFSKSGREANINDKHLSNLRKGMVNSLNNENDIEELKAYKKWILNDSIAWNEETLAGMDDENQKEVMRNHIDWLKKFVNKIDKKIAKLEKNPVEINNDEYEGRY